MREGERLGAYEVLGLLGVGGMGEVYRAKDSRLNRDVAIKMLPGSTAHDAERLSRFNREAKLQASLSHPNIAAVHGFEEVDGHPFLVLELVEGPTLADRLANEALPLNESIDVARQITEALEAAHEKGVIHRDLKPANIKLTPSGQVKVLDFGLAKILVEADSDAGSSATDTEQLTQPGSFIGTAAYMSPEQLRGQHIDKRTDIWAFGCCFFEMLTGARAFQGQTRTDLVVSLLERSPEWRLLPDGTPHRIRHLLHQCLQKEARNRLRDIGDARLELTQGSSISNLELPLPGELQEASRSSRASTASVIERSQEGKRSWVIPLVAFASAAIAALATFLTVSRDEPAVAPTPSKLSILLPDGEKIAFGRFATLSVARQSIAISPDGKSVVYAAVRDSSSQLFIRNIDSFEVNALKGTEEAFNPFFSPDGNSIGFFTPRGLHIMSVRGGRPDLLCRASDPIGASWGPDDTIVFSDRLGGQLKMIPAKGGTPKTIKLTTHLREPSPIAFPSHLPGGRQVVCCSRRGTIAIVTLKDGHVKLIDDIRGTSARYIATGHLLYARNGDVYGVAFDPATGSTTGSPALVFPGVRTVAFGAAHYDVSDSGSMVFVPGILVDKSRLKWRRRDEMGLEANFLPEFESYGEFYLSPDGKRVALVVGGPTTQIMIVDCATGRLERLTNQGESWAPVWSNDGTTMYYGGKRGDTIGVYKRPIHANGKETLLKETPFWPNPRTTNGSKLLVDASFGSDFKSGIYEFDLQSKQLSLFTERAWGASFSPDKNHVAYTLADTDGSKVFVVEYPYKDDSRRWRISNDDGGEEPLWSPDGDEIFYRSADKWMSVKVSTTPNFRAREPELIFEGSYRNPPGISYAYDGHEQRDRFLLLESFVSDAMAISHVNDAFSEIRRAAPVGTE